MLSRVSKSNVPQALLHSICPRQSVSCLLILAAGADKNGTEVEDAWLQREVIGMRSTGVEGTPSDKLAPAFGANCCKFRGSARDKNRSFFQSSKDCQWFDFNCLPRQCVENEIPIFNVSRTILLKLHSSIPIIHHFRAINDLHIAQQNHHASVERKSSIGITAKKHTKQTRIGHSDDNTFVSIRYQYQLEEDFML